MVGSGERPRYLEGTKGLVTIDAGIQRQQLVIILGPNVAEHQRLHCFGGVGSLQTSGRGGKGRS